MIGGHAPVIFERFALEQSQGNVGVADIDCQKHNFSRCNSLLY
jgi:hypothetical protein